MKILVTGGSGMVGRYVVDALTGSFDVEVLDLKPLHRGDVALHEIDILDLQAVEKTTIGFDAVVHLAGIPHPLNDPAEEVFHTNTLGTFNVLQASSLNKIPKFIFLSSESTLGFAFSTTRMWPEYLPIDENHPTRPQDPYGLSKLSCELLCRGYSAKSGIQTLCLRPPWIWVPEEKDISFYRELVREYPRWHKNLWAYIHVKDVAEAVRLSLTKNDLPLHEVCYLTANDNWTGKDSRGLAAEYYPETTNIDSNFRGDQSFISNAKAGRMLGFRPRYSWRDILA